jgi:hypothetical protein
MTPVAAAIRSNQSSLENRSASIISKKLLLVCSLAALTNELEHRRMLPLKLFEHLVGKARSSSVMN